MQRSISNFSTALGLIFLTHAAYGMDGEDPRKPIAPVLKKIQEGSKVADDEKEGPFVQKWAREPWEFPLSQDLTQKFIIYPYYSGYYNTISEISKGFYVIARSAPVVKFKPFFLRNENMAPYKPNNIMPMKMPTDFLQKFPRLTTLDLSDNRVVRDDCLQPSFFPYLTHLNLFCNTKINGSAMARLTTLTKLNIGGNSQVTDQDLAKLTRLQKLNLGANHGETAANYRITNQIMSQLTRLQTLNLGWNKIIHDEALACLTGLKKLGLAYNPQITIQSVAHLTMLQELDLKNNEIIHDEALACLTGLKKLGLAYNPQITTQSVAHLTMLQELDLKNNENIHDEALACLSGLKKLGLAYNFQINIQSVAHLTMLQELDLKNNWIIDDEALAFLPGLTKLELEGNSRITDKGLLSLSGLETLKVISNRNITMASLKQLSNLKHLTLNSRKSRLHTEELADLTCLQTLEIEGGYPPRHPERPKWYEMLKAKGVRLIGVPSGKVDGQLL